MTGAGTHDGGRTDGPLPSLFLVLAFTTGMIDGTSFLNLGQVFVAAMTGNIIILGLGLAGFGTPLPSALSLLSFAAGAIGGGRVVLPSLRRRHRGRLLAAGTAVQTALVCGASAVASVHGFTDTWNPLIILLLAFSLGWEYAIVRRMNVHDMNTTVITTTLTSLFAESVAPVKQGRRLASICALLAGAMASGLLRRALFPVAPLWAAALLLFGCVLILLIAARGPRGERWR